MQIEILEEHVGILPEYGKISIAFEVKTVFCVELIEHGLGGVKLTEEIVEKPYIKGYDEYESPFDWSKNFDLSNWGFISAFDGETRIGGAIVAWKTPAVNMLEGRDDLACLWDLRVAPEYRGKGAGQKLFQSAVDWARARNCKLFKVETQNINVPACRFYVAQGCHLGAFNFHAYPEAMNEVQLVWYRNL